MTNTFQTNFSRAEQHNAFIQDASALIKGEPFEGVNQDTALVMQNSVPQTEKKTYKNMTSADVENKVYV